MSDNNPQVSFLKKLYAILTAADGANPGAGPANPIYLAFCSPGIPFPPSALNFDPTTKDGLSNLAQWSNLVNTIPLAVADAGPVKATFTPKESSSTAGTWAAVGEHFDSIYEDFLSGAQAQPHDLTDEEKELHDKALTYLVTVKKIKDPFTDEVKETRGDSEHYAAYKKCRKAYVDKLSDYNMARLTALSSSDPKDKAAFAVNGNTLLQGIQSAFDDWEANGDKVYVEKALDILANSSGKSFVRQLEEANSAFNASTLSDPLHGTYHPTPPVPFQFFSDQWAEASWSTYSFHHSETSAYSGQSSAHIAGATGDFFGDVFGFNVGASADMNLNAQFVAEDEDNWSVQFELTQVPLDRGWFRYDLLTSHVWQWSQDATLKDAKISTGHIPLNSAAEAKVPVYPTSVLMVRNVKIKSSVKKLRQALAKYDQSVDVHIGWGPFNLGNVKESSSGSGSYNHVTVDDNGLQSDGVSIIGFICNIITEELPYPQQQ